MLNRKVSRRGFMKSAAAVSLGFTGLHQMMQSQGYARGMRGTSVGYGPLVTDPQGVFDLPAGFSYKIISVQGDTMSDGFLFPGLQDGMAAFAGENGRTILICNHELSQSDAAKGPFGAANQFLNNLSADKIYDRGSGTAPAQGGCTTIIYNTQTQEVESTRLSLAGTMRNCAGGPTPWGSWVTCEENVQRATGNFEKDHGYCFEVPAEMTGGVVTPVPLTGMGRFNHEAIAVDPKSGVVYLTEDRSDGLVYRFIPNVPGNLAAGGTLQALAVKGQPSLDTRNWGTNDIAVGTVMEVEWINLTNIDSPNDDLRTRGFNSGAARFARGEGMWFGNNAIFFACTNGGVAEQGQVWRYQPSPVEGQAGEAAQPAKLQLFVQPDDAGLINNADNLTVSPWGDLIVCEDGTGSDRLLGITPEGEIYEFALNQLNTSELAGACFSPDGTTLFCNIQSVGYTLAITGPFRTAPLSDQWWVY